MAKHNIVAALVLKWFLLACIMNIHTYHNSHMISIHTYHNSHMINIHAYHNSHMISIHAYHNSYSGYGQQNWEGVP